MSLNCSLLPGFIEQTMEKMRFLYRQSYCSCFKQRSSTCGLSCCSCFWCRNNDTSTVNAPVVTTGNYRNSWKYFSCSTLKTLSLPHLQHNNNSNNRPDTCCPTENTTPTLSLLMETRSNNSSYKEDGTLDYESVKMILGWHYVDASGNAVKGWYTTPNGKTYLTQLTQGCA